jgi:serine/threonine-protein kinase HipA
MTRQDNALDVWLDDDLGPPCLVGTLAHGRGQIRFHDERDWLKDPRAFALDPDLSLDEHPFFPKPELGNFGIFLDSSPDRWGQTLTKRREALQAKDEKRSPRTLYAWDFLIGVQDQTRQGALRFRRPDTETFLGDEKMAAPPVTTLRELKAVAYQLSNRRIDDLDALRRWLAMLVAPGASLG